MYGVLIVPPPADVDLAARELAFALGSTAYDQRQPLLRGLPWVVAWGDQVESARELAGRLRATGLQAWPISQAALEMNVDLIDVRSFSASVEGLSVADRVGRQAQAGWNDVGVVLPCRADLGQTVTTQTTTSKTSMVKLAMGVPLPSKQVETAKSHSVQSNFFCLVWLRSCQPGGNEVWLRLDSDGMEYTGLGQERTASSTANYLLLLQWLQRFAPSAWDARLERAGGKIAPVPLPPRDSNDQVNRKTSVAVHARSWETESAVLQAARLLVLASRLKAAALARGLQ